MKNWWNKWKIELKKQCRKNRVELKMSNNKKWPKRWENEPVAILHKFCLRKFYSFTDTKTIYATEMWWRELNGKLFLLARVASIITFLMKWESWDFLPFCIAHLLFHFDILIVCNWKKRGEKKRKECNRFFLDHLNAELQLLIDTWWT